MVKLPPLMTNSLAFWNMESSEQIRFSEVTRRKDMVAYARRCLGGLQASAPELVAQKLTLRVSHVFLP